MIYEKLYSRNILSHLANIMMLQIYQFESLYDDKMEAEMGIPSQDAYYPPTKMSSKFSERNIPMAKKVLKHGRL